MDYWEGAGGIGTLRNHQRAYSVWVSTINILEPVLLLVHGEEK